MEAAEFLDSTKQQVNRWVKAGRLRLNANKKTDQDELERFAAEQDDKQNGKLNLFDEQARLTKINADLKELDLRNRQGELVEVDAVVGEVGKLVFAVRQRLLGLGSRLAPVLAKRPAGFIKDEIDKAIHETLNEFGKYNAESGECGPAKSTRKSRKPRAKSKAPAKTKRQRVVR